MNDYLSIAGLQIKNNPLVFGDSNKTTPKDLKTLMVKGLRTKESRVYVEVEGVGIINQIAEHHTIQFKYKTNVPILIRIRSLYMKPFERILPLLKKDVVY